MPLSACSGNQIKSLQSVACGIQGRYTKPHDTRYLTKALTGDSYAMLILIYLLTVLS